MPNYMLDAMQGYKFVNDINRQDERDKMLERQNALAMEREQRAIDQDTANKNVAKVKADAALMGLGIGAQPQHQVQQQQATQQQSPIYHGWNQVLGKYGIDPNSEQGAAATGKVQHLLNDTEARVQALSLNDSIKKSLNAGGLPHVKDLAAYMNIMGHKELSARGGDDGLQRAVHGVYPGPDGKTAVIEFEVTKPDGTKYLAPATTGKSADPKDDTVQQLPVQDLLKWFAGSTEALRMTLEAEAAAGRTDTIDRYRDYLEKRQALNDQVTVKGTDDYASDGKNLVSKNEYMKMPAEQRARFVPFAIDERNMKERQLNASISAANKPGEFEKKVAQVRSMGLSPEEEKRAILQISGGAERGPSEIAQLGLMMKQDAVATNERNRKAEVRYKIAEIKSDSFGKVDEDNVGKINALLESIEEPPYEAVEVSPEVKRRFRDDTPAQYKYVQRPSPARQQGEAQGIGGGLPGTGGVDKSTGDKQPSTSLTPQQIVKIEARISAEKDPAKKAAMQAEYDNLMGVK